MLRTDAYMRPVSIASRAGLLALALLTLAPAGCIVNTPDNTPKTVTVELINTTSFIVDANFFRSGAAPDATALFVAGNIYTGYSSSPIPTLGANQTVSFELSCDDAASIGVRRPVFTNPLNLTGGESADEIFQRRGVNFSCGQRIQFTYSATSGFTVAVSVTN